MYTLRGKTMEVVTATEFRSNLFKILKKVLMGFEVKIKTRNGTILMIDENKFKHKGESRKTDILKPKAKGEIIGSLDDADRLLRKHIKAPKI